MSLSLALDLSLGSVAMQGGGAGLTDTATEGDDYVFTADDGVAYDIYVDGVNTATISSAPWQYTVSTVSPGSFTLQPYRAGVPAQALLTVTVAAIAPVLTAPLDLSSAPEGDPLTATATVFSVPNTTSVTVELRDAPTGNVLDSFNKAASPYSDTLDLTGLDGETVYIVAIRHTAGADVESDPVEVEVTDVAPLAYTRQIFYADGTLTTPATFYGLDGTTANQARIGAIGSGGDGQTAVGGGGGAEGRGGALVTLAPSTAYAVQIGSGGGEDTTLDGTLVVAKGGQNRAAGGAGGTGGTGGTGRDGATGTDSATNAAGGCAGGTVSAASAGTPGEIEPGARVAGTTNSLNWPGGGGSSSSSAANTGATGLLVAEWLEPVSAGYARCRGFSPYRDTANATTRDVTPPDGDIGDEIVAFVASNNTIAPDATGTGWTSTTARATTGAQGQWWQKTATGAAGSSDVMTITSGNGQLCAHVWRFSGASATLVEAGNTGATANPAGVTFGASGKHVVLTGLAMRPDTGLAVIGAPSGCSQGAAMGKRTSSIPYCLTALCLVDGASLDLGAWDVGTSGNKAMSTIAIGPA